MKSNKKIVSVLLLTILFVSIFSIPISTAGKPDNTKITGKDKAESQRGVKPDNPNKVKPAKDNQPEESLLDPTPENDTITEPEEVQETIPETNSTEETVVILETENTTETVLTTYEEGPVVLNGFSGSVDSYQDIDKIIQALDTYGGNCYRIAFNPVWTIGSRPWAESYRYGPSGVDKINYFLENCDYYLIVDRNHFTDNVRLPYDDPYSNKDWVQIEKSIFDDVLANFGNNPRVLIEIINEYPHYDMYLYCENIVQRIKAAGYTNQILMNKHTQANDWERNQQETPSLDYYGHHAYFNNLDDPSTIWQTLWGIQNHMENAMTSGCYPIVNTEIGASYKENNDFTVENVAITNQFLHWSNERNIGNLIWMNHNLWNLPKYEALGFDPQWTIYSASTSS